MIHNVKFHVVLPRDSKILRGGDYGVADIWVTKDENEVRGNENQRRISAIVSFAIDGVANRHEPGFSMDTSVELKSGHYFVRLKYPNGQLQGQIVDIRGDQREILISLNAPSEDILRQHRECIRSSQLNARRLKPKGLKKNNLFVTLLSTIPNRKLNENLHSSEVKSIKEPSTDFSLEYFEKISRFNDIFGEVIGICKVEKNSSEANGLWSALSKETPQSIASTNLHGIPIRNFVLVSSEKSDNKVIGCIPLPWLAEYSENQWDTYIYIKANSGDSRGDCLSIGVSDPRIQSILGFLNQGDLDASTQLVTLSLDYLWAKFENPFAAVAAGYVLVMAPQLPQGKVAEWEYWIGNLGKYFEQIPDGNILHATLLLQRINVVGCDGKSSAYFPSELSERVLLAHNLILTAVSMGPPLYRLGLRLLTSNLRILSNSTEPTLNKKALQDASQIVDFLNIRVNPAEAFSIFDIS